MNFRKCIVLGTICCSFVLTANAVEQADLNSKVAQLNQQSIKLLGVSLNALRYLVEASSTNYLLLSHLEQTGDINLLRELEQKGYVKVQITQGLPDGTSKSDRFARVIPLGDGLALQKCVVALQSGIAAK